jgi:hypothetical protein
MLGLLGHLTQPNPAQQSPVHSKLLALEQYWKDNCPADGLPGRSHFNAERMIPWLPHICIVDAIRAPLRFRFRLMGSGCIRYAGADHTGKWIDECVSEPDRNEVLTPFIECIDGLGPVYKSGIRNMTGSAKSSVDRLFLPCTNDGMSTNLIVMGVYAMELSPA